MNRDEPRILADLIRLADQWKREWERELDAAREGVDVDRVIIRDRVDEIVLIEQARAALHRYVAGVPAHATKMHGDLWAGVCGALGFAGGALTHALEVNPVLGALATITPLALAYLVLNWKRLMRLTR